MSERRTTTSAPSDKQLFGRALGVGLVGLAAVGVIVAVQQGRASHPNRQLDAFINPPAVSVSVPDLPRLEALPLTAELRRRGYNECNPHDPIGLGPYAPFRNLIMGQIAIPQRGGHTPDLGYDVVVHFHGKSAVRKTLVQVARGVVFVGVDRGVGSGPYSTPFKNPQLFPKLRRSIEGALRRHTGDERAHIRHLALSAWSAGYGGVNEILKRHADSVDAVVLLDGLHGAWDRTRPRRLKLVSDRNISPTFDFARRALEGEKILIFTHSNVDPVRYPSTALTAQLLLQRLGVEAAPVPDSGAAFAQITRFDRHGLHVWGYRGSDKPAHCAHISLIADAVRDILEPAWQTPAMDRSVPPTPAPRLGGKKRGSDDGAEPTLELQQVDENALVPARAVGVSVARTRSRRGPGALVVDPKGVRETLRAAPLRAEAPAAGRLPAVAAARRSSTDG